MLKTRQTVFRFLSEFPISKAQETGTPPPPKKIRLGVFWCFGVQNDSQVSRAGFWLWVPWATCWIRTWVLGLTVAMGEVALWLCYYEARNCWVIAGSVEETRQITGDIGLWLFASLWPAWGVCLRHILAFLNSFSLSLSLCLSVSLASSHWSTKRERERDTDRSKKTNAGSPTSCTFLSLSYIPFPFCKVFHFTSCLNFWIMPLFCLPMTFQQEKYIGSLQFFNPGAPFQNISLGQEVSSAYSASFLLLINFWSNQKQSTHVNKIYFHFRVRHHLLGT